MRPRLTPGLLAVLLALALAGTGGAMAAPARQGRHYSGRTKQGRTISFDVSTTGKRVVHPIVNLQTHCFGGGNSFAETSARATARASGLIKHGKFVLRFSERAKVKGGITAIASFILHGHFASRRRALGTASVTVHYSDHVECVSGAVSYRVRG